MLSTPIPCARLKPSRHWLIPDVGVVGRFIPLLIVCLLVFTEPGRDIWTAGVDWVSGRAEVVAEDRIEEQQLAERLRGVEPLCAGDYTPEGFAVTGGQAIALAVGDRNVDCDLVDLEPMDNETWAVHVDAARANGCEFSAVIDGKTGEELEGSGGCP